MKAPGAIAGMIALISLASGGVCHAESTADYLSSKIAAVGLSHSSSPFLSNSDNSLSRKVNIVSCSSGEYKCSVGAQQWCCPNGTPCENDDGTPHDRCHD